MSWRPQTVDQPPTLVCSASSGVGGQTDEWGHGLRASGGGPTSGGMAGVGGVSLLRVVESRGASGQCDGFAFLDELVPSGYLKFRSAYRWRSIRQGESRMARWIDFEWIVAFVLVAMVQLLVMAQLPANTLLVVLFVLAYLAIQSLIVPRYFDLRLSRPDHPDCWQYLVVNEALFVWLLAVILCIHYLCRV